MVIGIVAVGVFVMLLAALYVWTRRSERDIEIPQRELTDEQQQAQLVARGVTGSYFQGGMGGGGGL